jgi:branched-chain amino acid transport system substrate-binding protein
LVDVDEADVLMGDICSSASLAIADLADERKMVLVNAGTVAKQLTDSPYVFRIWFSEEKLGTKIAEKAVQLGCDKMAIIYVNNDFGKGFGDVVEKKFLELGGESVLSQPFNQEETDFKTGILKAEDANSACYFLALYPDGLVSALKQMKEANVKKTVFAHGGIIGTAQTMNIGQGILEGVYAPFFAQPSKEFRARYEAAFGGKAGVTADAAYDAVYLIAQAVSSNGFNPENITAGVSSG